MADLKITVDKSDLVGLIKTTDQTKQAVKLMSAEFSRTGNQSAYLRSINQIVAAQNRLPVAMRMSRKEIMSLGQQYRQQVSFTDELTRAQNQLNMATQRSARGMNRSGVIMQQTGYQVGDFLVQVQSGTNAFVAFGQQATQVAGTLTMLGGKWVMIGSALGIALPLLTAIGAYLMRTRKEAEDTVDPLEELADSMNELAEVDLSQLGAGFRAVSEEADVLLEKITELRTERLRDSLQQSISDILTGGEFGRIQEQLEAQFQAGGAGFTLGTTEFEQAALAAGISQEALDAYDNYYQIQQIMNQISGDSAPELAQSLAEATAQLEEQGALSPYLLSEIEKMVDALGLESELLEDNTQELERQKETRQRIRAFVSEQTRDLENQTRLMQLIFTHGEDSRQVEEERMRQARLAYLIELMREGVQGRQLANLMAQYDEYARLNSIMNLPVYGPEVPDGFGDNDPPSGRSGQTRKSIDEIIAARQKQLDQEQILLEISRDRAAARAIEFELENQYQGEVTETMREQIQAAAESMAAQEEQIRKLEEIRDRNKEVADTIADSFGKAFTSIMDGTKSTSEAFKDMARQIIADLYQIYVVKKITGFISGAIDNFLGGGAGVVDTQYTGGSMRANQPYLVGENGPELVIPRKSSTVVNADLTSKALGSGGGETVVVNQTINVSTGVQQTVRNEIQSLMPQISEAAKVAVVDAKRRGGSYGRAFS